MSVLFRINWNGSQDWFNDYESDVNLMLWLSQLLDLILTEHLWNILS